NRKVPRPRNTTFLVASRRVAVATIGRPATSLAGGAPRVETFPLHPSPRAAGERDRPGGRLTGLHVLRDPDCSDRGPNGEMLANLQGSAVLELLAKTLTELGSVAGSAARWAGQEGRTVSAPLDPLPVESCAACSLGDDAPCDGTSAILVADVDAATEHDPEHW